MFGVGALGAAGSDCDCGVVGMAENLKHSERKPKLNCLVCLVGPHACMCGGCVRGELVSAGTHGAGVPGEPVLICGDDWTVMADNRAEANGVGETKVMAVTW